MNQRPVAHWPRLALGRSPISPRALALSPQCGTTATTTHTRPDPHRQHQEASRCRDDDGHRTQSAEREDVDFRRTRSPSSADGVLSQREHANSPSHGPSATKTGNSWGNQRPLIVLRLQEASPRLYIPNPSIQNICTIKNIKVNISVDSNSNSIKFNCCAIKSFPQYLINYLLHASISTLLRNTKPLYTLLLFVNCILFFLLRGVSSAIRKNSYDFGMVCQFNAF